MDNSKTENKLARQKPGPPFKYGTPTKVIGVRIPVDMIQELADMAVDRETTRNALIVGELVDLLAGV